jgi:hypothetical protein
MSAGRADSISGSPIEGGVDLACIEVAREIRPLWVEPSTSRFTERGYTMPFQSG